MASDRGYHVAVDIDDANSFIYALTNCFKTVIEAVAEQQRSIKEKLATGEPVEVSDVFAAKTETSEPEPETVTIYKKDWDSLVHMATLFREHPEATEGYKISVGADLAGTVLYVDEHIIK